MKERRIPRFHRLDSLVHSFSPAEKMLLWSLMALLIGSAFVLFVGFNRAFSVVVPSRGGSLSEGAVGTPRFINPLLAISQTDEDLSALIYSGLTRAAPDGSHTPDLADSYEISEDGTRYTFHLRESATFHDGTPVTSADVLFTIRKAQDPNIKSPRRADWEGVSVAAPDTHTVVFTLPNAYAPFIENTELGILPEHLWKDISADDFPFDPLNTHPVGSGPFLVHDVDVDDTGSPVRYELAPFDDFTLGAPPLRSLTFRFFSNENDLLAAYHAGSIDAFAADSPDALPSGISDDSHIYTAPLTRVFGVFFNQNHSAILTDAAVRAALNAAVDKEAIVEEVLGGYGTGLDSPIPPGIIPGVPVALEEATSSEARISEARDILSRNDWDFDEATGAWTKGDRTLSLSLATPDTEELVHIADRIAESWRSAGVQVDVHVYPLNQFNTDVLRPREYDAVLFGEVVGRTLDLFAFWHSSQRNDPGLNLALYTNTSADRILSEARAESDRKKRWELYRSFIDTLSEDHPAIFLFSPTFIYVAPESMHGITISALSMPSERFTNVYQWYTDTERLWSLFDRSSTTLQ